MNLNKEVKNRVVVIDNYDSFTFNLVQYLGELGCDPLVFRNDEIEPQTLEEMKPRSLVISPGPGTPDDSRYFGISLQVLQELSLGIPTLGVCLGHQGVAVAYGGEVVIAQTLYHGKATEIHHGQVGIFSGIPDPFTGARYHSLIIDPDSFPSELEVTARGPEGEIMALRHKDYPIYGVQFHPESILTEHGKGILNNFLNIARGEKK